MLIVRSLVFNALFYVMLFVYMTAALPTFFMSRHGILYFVKVWGRSTNWLLRVICGIRVEYSGIERIPPGGLIVAAKHQSMWETVALIPLLSDPTIIHKRELRWIPWFGWYMAKAELIPINRGARSQALATMTEQARREVGRGRQLLIFPEGTRRAAGAEPAYKYGVARLYAETGAACVPIALNSGVFWPRRSFLRYPGTIRAEILEPIQPGLSKEEFFERLQRDIETATERLVSEGMTERARNLEGRL